MYFSVMKRTNQGLFVNKLSCTRYSVIILPFLLINKQLSGFVNLVIRWQLFSFCWYFSCTAEMNG